MKKLGLIAALSAVMGLTSTAVLAAESQPSFDYMSASYLNADVSDIHVGGAKIDYSQSFNDKIFGYAQASFLTKGDLDNIQAVVGFGYKHAIAPATALYGVIGVAHDRIELGSLSDSDTGYTALAGVRHAFNNKFELDAHIQHLDVWDESDQSYVVGGKYYLNPSWALQANYSYIDSDTSMLSFGVSYNF
ncbi:hypothetical protein SAMN02927930_00746 [Pseudidiomarina indica]|uniref:Outer membrane protein beta-barrel domain-containing protein n=1 Tax=Pseudidiomarina indica TaxID=1159017 RepID=A0A1G6BEA3_9GAMM|nr:outer membrane beta-barrel protein [Pseudidiomarina indica]SDB18975.1 hypothetical protein SAMN02927930_00746 [Pseudidiomarina indica]